jgi:hypothetical protein
MWQVLSMTLGINYRQCQLNGGKFATGINNTGRIIGALEKMIPLFKNLATLSLYMNAHLWFHSNNAHLYFQFMFPQCCFITKFHLDKVLLKDQLL